jgi:hypothetical protein
VWRGGPGETAGHPAHCTQNVTTADTVNDLALIRGRRAPGVPSALVILSAPTMARPADRLAVLLVGVVVILTAVPAAAQTVSDGRVWTGFVGQGRFADQSPWRWSFDAALRTKGGADRLDSVTARMIINWQMSERSTVGAGYQYGTLFGDEDETIGEHRFVQQFIWSRPAGRFSVSLRSRLEERVVEGNNGTIVRARQQVRLTRNLTADARLLLVTYDELFLYTNTTARASRGFDSHRVAAGIRRAVTARTGVEITYINIYARTTSAYRRSHVLSANVQASF